MSRLPCTLILAGGEGRRVGGRDKGLLYWQERPLIEHVFERIRPQSGTVLISANRNLPQYRRYAPVLPDDPQWLGIGPLAALATLAAQQPSETVLTVPCDTPLLPADLAERMQTAARVSGSAVVYAATAERSHYGILLLEPSVLPTVAPYLKNGGRSIRGWLAELPHCSVPFEDESAFANFNRPQDWPQTASSDSTDGCRETN